MSRSRIPAHAEGNLDSNDLKERFDQILGEAAAGIKLEWFKLPVIGRGSVYRERVYCYELYHQMRSRWPKGTGWVLNGEVDKRNHPHLGGRAPKPDFLAHVPGKSRNYAVIEVKSCKYYRVAGIKSDIEKLIRFTKEIRFSYHRAIYLIFGRKARCFAARVQGTLKKYGQAAASVEVWVHSCVGKQATRVDSSVFRNQLLVGKTGRKTAKDERETV